MCVVVGGRTSLKNHKFFWGILEKSYWTPTPGLYFSWTPWNLVWPESPRDFSKAWTSQQTLPRNWLNSLLYYNLMDKSQGGGGGALWWGPPRGFGEQGKKGIYFRGTKAKFWGEQRKKNIWEQGTYENKFSIFWEQANLFQGNKGTGSPPWEGLSDTLIHT